MFLFKAEVRPTLGKCQKQALGYEALLISADEVKERALTEHSHGRDQIGLYGGDGRISVIRKDGKPCNARWTVRTVA